MVVRNSCYTMGNNIDMNTQNAYPIGTPGEPWGEKEKAQWFERQSVKRSYHQEVVSKLENLRQRFTLIRYGGLSQSKVRYPLYAVKIGKWDGAKPGILITGGVHGYETSGVQGAIRFLETTASAYLGNFDFLVAPCVSPWAYETINRWNPAAIDPNRSFYANSPCEESAALMALVDSGEYELTAHFDLHETTETDNTEFRPALAARDAVSHDNWHIPDGFYTVGDTGKPEPGFQKAVIDSVEKVTHIAPPAEDGKIIGEAVEQWGVINYRAKELGLCMGLSDARFVTTTEVYPDSPRVTDKDCILAQVAAVTGGLDYINRGCP